MSLQRGELHRATHLAKDVTERADFPLHLGEALRLPIAEVLSNARQLLNMASTRNDLAESDLLGDLHKIVTSGEHLSSLVETLLNAQTRLDPAAFTATIRHDLRTPVNAIIGYSEMLLEDLEPRQDLKFTQEPLQKTLNAGRRLLTLINELIYFARKDAPAPTELTSGETLSSHLMQDFTPPAVSESAMEGGMEYGYLLVVDDKDSNRDLLSRQLARHGFQVDTAENGRIALEMLRRNEYDLVLLDVIMPELNGYQALAEMRADETLRHLPVLMISALDEIDSVVRCIEMGAQDYLQKPFNPVILKAKINAALERKRLRDREQAYLKQLQVEQEKSERLLLNILPKVIADRLKSGEHTIADSFGEVTVLFADLVNFTQLCSAISPAKLVERLNEIFLAFDILTELYGLEKIKTIGDAYMLVGGLPTPRPDHARAVAEMALDMFDAIQRLNRKNGDHLQIRVGIHTGPVVAGVIGKNKFNYDLWGDAVNIASRMESHSLPGEIQVSQNTWLHLRDDFIFDPRGPVQVKGKGEMNTYLLKGKKLRI